MRQSLVLTFPGAEFVAPLEFAGNIEGMTLMAFSSMNFESKTARGQQRKKNQAQCKQIYRKIETKRSTQSATAKTTAGQGKHFNGKVVNMKS